jgi:hypothetical protein
MASLPITERLLEHAKHDLELAEKQLAEDRDNEWRRKAVLHAREKVDSIRRLLHDDKTNH